MVRKYVDLVKDDDDLVVELAHPVEVLIDRGSVVLKIETETGVAEERVEDARGCRVGEAVRVAGSDTEGLSFEFVDDVLRGGRLAGTGGSGDEYILTGPVVLDRTEAKREVLNRTFAVVEFRGDELVAERAGITYHLGGISPDGGLKVSHVQ